VTSPLSDVKLHLIQGLDDVLAMYEWASQERDTPIAMDTESEGLQPLTDRLRLIQLGDKNHGWAMPIEWAGAAVELMRKLFARKNHIVCHNSVFDLRVVNHSLGYQIPWHFVHDTMILAALTDPTRQKGLKPLSTRLVDPHADSGQKLLSDGMKANGWTWATVPVDFPPYWIYACADPVLTAHLWGMLSDGVLRDAPQAYDLERSVTPILAGMMDHGLLLDRDYTAEKLRELREYSGSARQWLREAHEVTSLMSARQIASALELVGAPIQGRTSSGLPQVTKEVLRFISVSADFPEEARQLADTILRARHAEKLAGTYLENFLEIMGPDGRVRPSIQQLQARTGRMSCTDPNIQNLPRDDKIVRGCFIPRPGCVLISCDFSQVEMRIAAALSNDPGLIAAFAEADSGGRDFYSAIAGELFGGDVLKSDPRRQAVKSMSYASLYGAGLAKQALTAGVTVEQLRPIRDAFDARFPGLSRLPRLIQAEVAFHAGEDPEGRPMVRTSLGRPLPGDPQRVYALLNYKVQSEAAEALKRAIVSVASAGLSQYALAPIHDEVLFEVPEKEAPEIRAEIVKAMTDNDYYAVPITAEAKIMPVRWEKG
jgi:DNA polymerase I